MNSKLKADYIELINAELDGIQFLSVADIQDFVVFVKYTSTPLDLPRLHLLKELYDNEYSYVCDPDPIVEAQLLREFQSLVIDRLNAMVVALDLKTNAELEAYIDAQAKIKSEKQAVRNQDIPEPRSELTAEQMQAIRHINSFDENIVLIAYTIKREEAPLCIDAATTLLHLNRLTAENAVNTEQPAQLQLIKALGAYYGLMEKYFGYDQGFSLRILGADKIAAVKQILIHILTMFNSSRIPLAQFNSYHNFLRKYLLVNPNLSMELLDVLDDNSNNMYFNALYMLDGVNRLLRDGLESESLAYKYVLKTNIMRFLNLNFGIKIRINSFDFNEVQKQLSDIVNIFWNVIAKYGLDYSVFKTYGLEKLSLIANKEVADVLSLYKDTIIETLNLSLCMPLDKSMFVAKDAQRFARLVSLVASNDWDKNALNSLPQSDFESLIINPNRRKRIAM